jgi:hypothetical protein
MKIKLRPSLGSCVIQFPPLSSLLRISVRKGLSDVYYSTALPVFGRRGALGRHMRGHCGAGSAAQRHRHTESIHRNQGRTSGGGGFNSPEIPKF